MKYARLSLALVALAACSTDKATGPQPDLTSSASVSSDSRRNNYDDDREEDGAGVVYTLSNQASGNAVLAYRRSQNGSLTPSGTYASGGNGTGGGLGSQGAVTFSRDGELLFVVNAGSNSISAFRVDDDRLRLVSTAPSGGVLPISVTASGGLVYVLNAGGSGNIAGLRYSENGRLNPIPNSSQPLSTSSSAPAQIEFTPDGNRLIVTEKGTNMIGAYTVRSNGRAEPGVFTASSGATPFGFAFRRNVLIVAEAFGGAAGASAASSYRVGAAGPPSLISGTVPTTQTAACWFVVTGNGKYAYTTNTGSGTITGYAVDNVGALTRLAADGKSAVLGAPGPADAALSAGSRFLYSRNGNGTISAVRVHADGSLTVLGGGVAGLPTGAVGLAAR
jgi:6-phosphogluconolactonase (cycloisomerase 2 family)